MTFQEKKIQETDLAHQPATEEQRKKLIEEKIISLVIKDPDYINLIEAY